MSAQIDTKISAGNDTTPSAGPNAVPQPQVQAEDDEFEDFPMEDWEDKKEDTDHLWDESWDDEDHENSFHSQLKAEMKALEERAKRDQ